MFSHISNQNNKKHKFMTEEQFEKIVDAVLAGKYSWACVLILQAGGYNPAHYIPYRTYNRLIKNNRLGKQKEHQQDEANQSQELSQTTSNDMDKKDLSITVRNLSYLEKVNQDEEKTSGGWRIISCNS